MQEKINGKKQIVRCIKALSVSCIWTAVMLLLLTSVCYRWEIGEGKIAIAVIVIYVSATFIGGFLIGKYNKIKKFLWGASIGLMYYILLVILTLIMNQGLSDHNIVSTMILCICGGMLGGMIS